MERETYDYVAFISYRHEPVGLKWATWLQNAIENYRVPWSLVRLGKAPRRLGKCFRDVGELAASADLGTTIDAALRASKYLIVICTPRTPHSRWVVEEIKRFRELGRADRILALLVEGEPRESFPPALLEIRPSVAGEGAYDQPIQQIEPLAADLRTEIGAAGGHGRGHLRSMAKLRIIAALLGLNFDDLYNRDARRSYGRMLATLGMSVAVAAAMIGLTVFAFAQKAEAARQRDIALRETETAKAFRDFLLNDVLSGLASDDLRSARSRDELLKDLLESSPGRISERFAGRPLIEADVRFAVSQTFDALQRPDLALPHAFTVLQIRRRELGNDHESTLDALDHYAQALHSVGKTDEAERHYREELDGWVRTRGPDDPHSISARSNLGVLLLDEGRFNDAEPLLKDALERSRKINGPEHADTVNSMCLYAACLAELDKPAPAEELYRTALSISRRAGEDNADALRIMNELGRLLVVSARLKEAEPLLRELLQRRYRLLGAQNRDTLSSTRNYGVLMERMGHVAEAETLYRLAAQTAKSWPGLGFENEKTRSYAESWARALIKLGRVEDAEKVEQEFDITAPRNTSAPPATPPDDDIARFVKKFAAEWK